MLPNPIPILPVNPPNGVDKPPERLLNLLQRHLSISSSQLSLDVFRSRVSLGDHRRINGLGPLSEPSLRQPFLGELIPGLRGKNLRVVPLSRRIVPTLKGLLSSNNPRILDNLAQFRYYSSWRAAALRRSG